MAAHTAAAGGAPACPQLQVSASSKTTAPKGSVLEVEASGTLNAFLDLCVRRGITEGEKDLIWNAMAMPCYEQVQERHGPFGEVIKPRFFEGHD